VTVVDFTEFLSPKRDAVHDYAAPLPSEVDTEQTQSTRIQRRLQDRDEDKNAIGRQRDSFFLGPQNAGSNDHRPWYREPLEREQEEEKEFVPNFDSTDPFQEKGLVGVLQFLNKSNLWGKRELFSSFEVEMIEGFGECLLGYILHGLEQERSLQRLGKGLREGKEREDNAMRRARRRIVSDRLKRRREEDEAFKLWTIEHLLRDAVNDGDRWQILGWSLSISTITGDIAEAHLIVQEAAMGGGDNYAAMMQGKLANPRGGAPRGSLGSLPTVTDRDGKGGSNFFENAGRTSKSAERSSMTAHTVLSTDSEGGWIGEMEEEAGQDMFDDQLESMGGDSMWAAMMGGNVQPRPSTMIDDDADEQYCTAAKNASSERSGVRWNPITQQLEACGVEGDDGGWASAL